MLSIRCYQLIASVEIVFSILFPLLSLIADILCLFPNVTLNSYFYPPLSLPPLTHPFIQSPFIFPFRSFLSQPPFSISPFPIAPLCPFKGLYDIHIHSRHLYFLEEDEGVSSHVELHDLTVSEIMTKRPICLRCQV